MTPLNKTPIPTSDEADKQALADTNLSTKQKLLGLIKKKDSKSEGEHASEISTQTRQSNSSTLDPTTTGRAGNMEAPPVATSSIAAAFASPTSELGQVPSASPKLHSPASSLIFERNVQESTLSADIAPAIPAHIKTEDQIPPALEASSLAITDSHLGPEELEIVTHTAHQPAAATIAQNITSAHQSETHLAISPESQHESSAFNPPHEREETAATYGTLDPNDVRRLSFISFADVVHAEHAESGSAQSLHHVPISGLPSDVAHSIRPISPTRSPLSSFSQPLSPEVTTPPASASGPGSAKGVELSPARSPVASPLVGSPHGHSELAIETLGQSIRKTASRDLSGFNRSPPSSAI